MHSLSVFKVSHAFWCCFMYVFFKVVSVWECTLITLFIWLCGVFAAARAFPWLWCEVVPLWWALWLQSWLGAWTAVTAVCGLSCSTRPRAQAQWCGTRAQLPAACGIFLDLGSNPCLLHWQEDSLPLSQHGSPQEYIILLYWFLCPKCFWTLIIYLKIFLAFLCR